MDDSLPFDFETYISAYQGPTRLKRAFFIAEQCAPLRVEAYTYALHIIQHETHNVGAYDVCLEKLNEARAIAGQEAIAAAHEWRETTLKQNKARLDQLEAELKTYRTNMVKESIRVAQGKLGDYYFDVGNMNDAFRHYSKTREFCTTSKHMVDLCFNMIKVHVESEQYHHLASYVARAEVIPQLPDKVNTLAALKCYQAIAALNGGDALAATATVSSLLTSHVTVDTSHAISQILAPSDIAIYGGLCSLASMDRRSLHELLNTNAAFRAFLELEPHIREIMELFQQSKYAECFALLDTHKPAWKLDVYLAPHIDKIIHCIRERAMVQYCLPYSAIDLRNMACAFNTTVQALETDLVRLIADKQKIQARIDSHDKILYTKRSNQRRQAYEQTIDIGEEYEKSARAIMLRLNLVKADMVVR
ncbi:26S proteasome subunit RPN7-domain-containing protein [Gongronella butleri]|nr:26S proteasome subunit RPN7-domain-containing protein [Gongronella butleri]